MDLKTELTTSETLFSLNIGGRLFTFPPHEAEAVIQALEDAARQVREAQSRLALNAFEQKRQRPDFWPHWTLNQGLTVLTRDGFLTDQAVIRCVGTFAREQPTSYDFTWLAWLGQTWNFDRFRVIAGLGDKRRHILREALVKFLALYPDRLYTGRLP